MHTSTQHDTLEISVRHRAAFALVGRRWQTTFSHLAVPHVVNLAGLLFVSAAHYLCGQGCFLHILDTVGERWRTSDGTIIAEEEENKLDSALRLAASRRC